MTAMNIFLQTDRAHLIADGAGIGIWSGKMRRVISKVSILSHLNCAIGVRGHIGVGRRVVTLANLCQSVEELQTVLPERLSSSYRVAAVLLPWLFHFSVHIAGVKEGRAFGLILDSRPPKDAGYRAFEPIQVEYMAAAPGNGFDFVKLAEGFDTDRRGDTRELDAAALRILEEQRRRWPDVVGGFGQVTTISNFGAYTRIIKRWAA